MESLSASWFGLGVVAVIGGIVVGLSISLAACIIRIFGEEHEAMAHKGHKCMPPHN